MKAVNSVTRKKKSDNQLTQQIYQSSVISKSENEDMWFASDAIKGWKTFE